MSVGMKYKIGEEVISIHKNFCYLKKGEVICTRSSTIIKVRMYHREGLTYFYYDQIANAKEFLQLQLEGKIK